MKKCIFLSLLITVNNLSLFAQYVSTDGGVVNGTLAAKSFIQTGSTIDFASFGVFTTTGINQEGGAVSRNFNAFTSLQANESLTVDMQGNYLVSFITFGTWYAGDLRFIPKAYKIDYSFDNVNWYNLVNVVSNANTSAVHPVGLSSRYWRLTVISPQDGQTLSKISGLQIISGGMGSAIGNSNLWNSPFNYSGIFTKSRVGIGTTQPGAKLDLKLGTDADFLKIQRNSNTGRSQIMLATEYGNEMWRFGLTRASGMDFCFNNGSTEVLKLFKNGISSFAYKLGVGTSNPDEMLTVNGKIHAQEVRVNPSIPVPDYVFDKGYQLQSLKDLEEYIQINKHLPDIPSALEIKNKGLSLSEMNLLLLKKIEELTLHTISLYKKVQEQSEIIEEIRKKN